jgi:hypothetical protein
MKKKGWVRVLSVLVILVIAFVLFSLWEGYVTSSSKELLSYAEQARQYGLQENWEEAGKALDTFDAKWNSMRDLWHAFIDHTEIDNISFSLARAHALVEVQGLDNYAAEIAALAEMLRHIPRRQTLSLGNLF